MNKKKSMQELKRLSNEQFKAARKHPIVLILDNIRSMNNVGSAFRTGDAFAIEHLFLCGITPQPPHREIHKTAIGATESVEWKYFESTTEAINLLKSEGYTICAIEQTENSISLTELSIQKDEKVAIIMGNEVNGVDQDVIDISDKCIEIPQFGTKHSLNVSVCTGVVLWELVKQLKK